MTMNEKSAYKVGDPPPDGYVAWHDWAEVQHKGGLRQKLCSRCGRWFYPQETWRHEGPTCQQRVV